jgi:capsular exopolysaccharide synthesis family protein
MELEKDPEVAQLRQQLSQYQQHLAAIRSSATGPNATPHVEQVQRQILHLEEQIEEIKHQRMPRLLELFRLNASGPDTRYPLTLEQLEEQRKYLAAKLEGAEKEVAAKKDQVSKMESFSAQVAATAEELNVLREYKNMVAVEMRRIETERLAPERIVKLEAAVPLGNGDAIRKYMAVIFSGLLCFSGVVLVVAVLEFQARKVNSVQEVNDGLGIRVVGELPNVRGRAFRRVRGGKGQNVLKALMAERIDGTRTALIHTTAIDPPRVVMITSADPHEGKTTTSTQLAASLARSGRRTLLIDADIRNPGVHRVFEMPQDPGLSELLRGEADRDAVIHPTRTANLWLMPAGRCDLRSVQAMSGAYLGSTIAALSVQFDYLIIDAGPVLKVADPLLVGQHVDAAIVSVLKDVSRVPRVYEAVERLRAVGITVLGSVVNGVKDDVARHGVELLMAETPRQQEPEEAETV